jgi:hypothetical protein
MTAKDLFTEQEWAVLRRALTAPGLYIVAADPRGEGDITREARAMEQFYADMRDQAERLGLSNKVLEALLTDTSSAPASEQGDDADLIALRQKYLDTIKEAVSILSAKASQQDVDEIKRMMYELAGQTAVASKEGSFLGMRGTRVTEAEKAALKEIADALGIQPE